MSGCCGTTSAIVASTVMIIVGVAADILSIVTISFDEDNLYVGIPGLAIGTMLIIVGVFGLVFAFNAENRCLMINAHVLSIISTIASVAWLFYGLIYSAIYLGFKADCDSFTEEPKDYRESCHYDFDYTIPGGLTTVGCALVGVVSSIVMFVSTALCECCNNNNTDSGSMQVVHYTTA